MRKSNPDLRRKLRLLEAKRARLLRTLLGTAPMLRGSLSRVMRTCGKPTCHCASKPGHPVWVLATSVGAARRCQVVRQDDISVVAERVAAYRAFRAALTEILAIQKKQKALMRGLAEKRNMPYE
jgi:hypothetical protein